MLRIYAFPTPNNTKVLITAEELGLEYELVRVDLSKGEQRSPDHLARHPLGKVPVIEHDGLTLFESNAICRYLAQVAGSELYPARLADRGRVDQWVDFFSFHAGRWVQAYFWEEVIKKGFFQKEPDPAALAEAQGFLDQQLPVLERQLEGRDFVATDRLTIADVIGYSLFVTQEVTSVDLSGYPNILRWLAAIKARPAVQRAEAQLSGQ